MTARSILTHFQIFFIPNILTDPVRISMTLKFVEFEVPLLINCGMMTNMKLKIWQMNNLKSIIHLANLLNVIFFAS